MPKGKVDQLTSATARTAPDDGAAPESQTKPKFAISGMSPADGTIAARVLPHWEFGISRWQLKNRLHHLSGTVKAPRAPSQPENRLHGGSELTTY
jgi:hypothetical protein